MATNFPTSLDDSSNIPNPASGNFLNSPDHASLHGNTGDGLKAVESKLGIAASTPVANRLLFGTGTGTSAWTQLTSAQLAASLSDETGSGSAVFATTPTLVTPKVDTINEATGGNGTTIGGVNIKSGALVTSNSVVTTNIANAAITPNKLATGATTAYLATSEATVSTIFADLTTTSDTVTVTIGLNGLAQIFISTAQVNNIQDNINSLGFTISGATTQAAADNYSISGRSNIANNGNYMSGAFLLTSLTQGSTTFKLKYKVNANTGTFTDRRISVIPL